MDYESIYRELFKEQLEDATEEYEEYFAGEFNPDRFNWDDEDEAKSALTSLLSELYEDMELEDYENLIEHYGINEDTLWPED